MDESLQLIICQALDEDRAKGRDYITQTELAVRAGQQRDGAVSCMNWIAIGTFYQ